MVGPARKREAVGHLKEELEMSERRACKVVGQPRSTQRYEADDDAEEDRLRRELREISRQRPRAGHRMAARCLRRGGWQVNDQRVQRIWREKGLNVARRTAQGHRGRHCSSFRCVWTSLTAFGGQRWTKDMPHPPFLSPAFQTGRSRSITERR